MAGLYGWGSASRRESCQTGIHYLLCTIEIAITLFAHLVNCFINYSAADLLLVLLLISVLFLYSKMVGCAVTLDMSFAQCLNREYRTVNKARC